MTALFACLFNCSWWCPLGLGSRAAGWSWNAHNGAAAEKLPEMLEFRNFFYTFVVAMKKLLILLVVCAAVGVASQAWAVPEPVPAVENVAGVPSVKGGDGRIYFYAGSSDAVFSVYSITGQLVRTVKVNADTHATIDISKGFYIVRYYNLWSRKVVVK